MAEATRIEAVGSSPPTGLRPSEESGVPPSAVSVKAAGVDWEARIYEVVATLSARLDAESDDDALQLELARLLDLIPDLATARNARLFPMVELAARALACPKPKLKLAKAIRENLQRQLRLNPIKAILRGGAPPTRVILGLGTLLYFAIPALLMFGPRLLKSGAVLGLESSSLALVALAGALGSIVSIMVRIEDFGAFKDVDQSVLFFTGFFKPVIGMAFALFVFAVLNSGIIPISIEPAKSQYFFAALAFVSGFSERFAADVASRTEDFVSQKGQQTAASGDTTRST